MAGEGVIRNTVAATSPDLRKELITQLMEIAPEAFADGKLDLERLKALVCDAAETGPERYTFSWAGKREAVAMLQAPTSATLLPDPERSVDFDGDQHIVIEGENLEVLKVLYRSYYGRVRLIYIDPSYNTGNDFIYPDDFSFPLDHYLRITGQKDQEGNYTTNKPDRTGRLHSAWLTMMYPRLALARRFLREDGFIVVSIDDAELHNLRRLMDEVFGEENRVAILVYDRNRKNDAKLFSVGHEYMVVYARSLGHLREMDTELRALKEGVEEVRAELERLRKEHNDNWAKVREGILEFYKTFTEDDSRKPLARYKQVDKDGPYRTDGDISWPGGGVPRYDVPHPQTGKPCKVPKRGWVYPTYERMQEEIKKNMVCFGKDETTIPSLRRNLFERTTQVMRSVIFSYAQVASQQFDAIFDGKKVFENPKSFTDLERLVSYLSEPGDIVLDFFAGSNTTMHGVIRANREAAIPRRVISVQMAEPIKAGEEAADNALALGMNTIADIARERIRRVVNSKEHRTENIGIRTFKLAPSNVRRWAGIAEKDADAYAAQLDAFTDTLIEGWKPENVVWEVALREGYSLTSRIEALGDAVALTWRVTDPEREQHFTICLTDRLSLEKMAALKLGQDDLFVCRDTALDDSLAANLALQCRLKVL